MKYKNIISVFCIFNSLLSYTIVYKNVDFNNPMSGFEQEKNVFMKAFEKAYRGKSYESVLTANCFDKILQKRISSLVVEYKQLVVLKNSIPVALAFFDIINNKIIYLAYLAVHPDFQGHNLGTMILNHIKEYKKHIFIIVRCDMNSLINWYKRNGFQDCDVKEFPKYLLECVEKSDYQLMHFLF